MALPESQLIRQELILRNMQLTTEVKLTRKSLIRWLALSLGLISPNESRALMLDLLEALFFFHFTHENPDINKIVEKVKEIRKEDADERRTKMIAKAVRYHLLQLKNRGILERKKGRYRFFISSDIESSDLGASLEHTYSLASKAAFEKIKKALNALERSY